MTSTHTVSAKDVERREMEICLAVDAYCSKEFDALEPHQLMALKFAGMMHMGVANPVHMMAAVIGSEHVDTMRLIAIADAMRKRPEQQEILTMATDGAKALLLLHDARNGTKH